MAKAKANEPSIVGTINITCYDNHESQIQIEGETRHIVAALAGLLSDKDEKNMFPHLIGAAIALTLAEDVEKEKKTKKKAKKA